METTARRILIVDDEPPLLKMMSVYLGRLGYPVETADATDKAWELVKADPLSYGLVVLDGSMPGMSMEELATRMLVANPALCVLSASGYPVDISRLDAKAPGRVAFLLKPFTPESLATAVRRLFGDEKKGL